MKYQLTSLDHKPFFEKWNVKQSKHVAKLFLLFLSLFALKQAFFQTYILAS